MQKTTEKYCWIELAAMLPGQKMARGEYVHLQDADKIDCWHKKHYNIDLFASVARYEKPDNNSESIVPLYFDIDSKDDLEGAREDAIRLCEMLCDRIGISYDFLAIFFSGHKGFHVIVPVEVFCPRYCEHVLDLLKIAVSILATIALNSSQKGIIGGIMLPYAALGLSILFALFLALIFEIQKKIKNSFNIKYNKTSIQNSTADTKLTKKETKIKR